MAERDLSKHREFIREYLALCQKHKLGLWYNFSMEEYRISEFDNGDFFYLIQDLIGYDRDNELFPNGLQTKFSDMKWLNG